MFLLTSSPFALSRWADFFANFGEFAKGFLYTLSMSACALILAFVLGVVFGAMSSSKSKVLKGLHGFMLRFSKIPHCWSNSCLCIMDLPLSQMGLS